MGKHLHELLGWPGPMTERQFAAWQEWQRREWNRPSRSDYYAMQIYAAVVASGGGKVSGWPKVSFGTADEAASGMTKEEATAIAKANAMARAGMPATIRKVRPDGTLIEETHL